MSEVRRHLRVVPPASDRPDWRDYLRAFREILEGVRGDRPLPFTAPAREALMVLAAQHMGTPRRRIDQMLDWMPPPMEAEVGATAPDAGLGRLLSAAPMHGDPIWRSLHRMRPMKPYAALRDNLAILRHNLLIWPEVIVASAGWRAQSTREADGGRPLSIADLAGAFGLFPRRIKQLQLMALRQEGLVREHHGRHARSVDAAIRDGRLFSDRPRPRAVRDFESLLACKYRLLEQRRGLLHDLAHAYGARFETLGRDGSIYRRPEGLWNLSGLDG